ncbi:hypothetical protein M422DRAFT_271608 [Sphaerobolus stellatus SS14]|uniref:Unplaced genomic scaffold SPHSTscaffold_267, whole genome shotgun sequence n=1 Tax=Sphaerobolus stellatus (strain SS14) TaxID=990650 RepID=A0A0C9UPG2_SPHS4|nr:hypothetical protein M422DRAFT_271608 [Sphaerobolus stellatus SS14]
MTDLQFPARMLAWKASTDVVRMDKIPIGDPRRTIRGFVPDDKFDAPAPKLVFDDPYEEEEDHLNKVTKYWKVRDERLMRESRDRVLRGAEAAAASRKRSEDAAKKLKEAQQKAAARDLEKETEKEAGPSGNVKSKAREMPATPKKTMPKKSQVKSWSESEDEEAEEEKPQCVYCVKKKLLVCPKSERRSWAVMDGSQKVVDAARKLVEMEKRQEAGCLKVVWHDLRMFLIQVEQKAVADSVAVDARVLQMLELKSKGVEIPADIEKWIRAERSLVQRTLEDNTEDLTEWMDFIRKHMAWTNNDLYRFKDPTPPPAPPPVAVQGTKRKNNEEGRAELKKKKKKKKVVETEKDDSTLR